MESNDGAAPKGFTQIPDPDDPDEFLEKWQAPTESGDGWRVLTTWTPDAGIYIRIAGADRDDSYGMTERQQVEATATLSRVRNTYGR